MSTSNRIASPTHLLLFSSLRLLILFAWSGNGVAMDRCRRDKHVWLPMGPQLITHILRTDRGDILPLLQLLMQR